MNKNVKIKTNSLNVLPCCPAPLHMHMYMFLCFVHGQIKWWWWWWGLYTKL